LDLLRAVSPPEMAAKIATNETRLFDPDARRLKDELGS
jgi:hypothetical protein